MTTMTGGEAVYHALRALGVDHVFGIVSVHNIPIYDAILRLGGIRPISVRHEQGAVHAADGYARATGKLGVAITSTGPGAANAMGGLFEAQFASSPVLMITGQIDTSYYGKGKGFLHEAERQLSMLRSITRRAESVRRTADVFDTIVAVANDIRTGRPQPGAVEIPIDLQYGTADIDTSPPPARVPAQLDTDGLRRAVEALGRAERPLIWAGGGVINAGAGNELVRLAEHLGAPVVTSTNGRGVIPETHELAMGPISGDPRFAPIVQEADVVLAVGTRFQAGATGQWKLAIPGTLIHLDADPGVIGRTYPPAIGIVCDAREGIAYLADHLEGVNTDVGFLVRAQEARDAVRVSIRDQMGPDFERVMDTMRRLLPDRAVIARDATIPAYIWGNRLIPIVRPRTSVNPTSAAIGPGLPLAIGAAIGSGQPAVVIQGDGGFMLSIAELATAAQHNVPVVVCVFNDGGYGVLRNIQSRTFEGRQTGVDLSTPDFAAVAKGMNVYGETVRGIDAFEPALERALAQNGPALLDIDLSTLAPMRMGPPPPPRKD